MTKDTQEPIPPIPAKKKELPNGCSITPVGKQFVASYHNGRSLQINSSKLASEDACLQWIFNTLQIKG
jgi:hypothetical protein